MTRPACAFLMICLIGTSYAVVREAAAMGSRKTAKEPTTSAMTANHQSKYFINHERVTPEAFEAFRKTLTGEEKWFCAETTDGGITGWESKDRAGRRFEIRMVSGGDNTSSITALDLEP